MADGSKQAAKQTGPEAEQPSQVRLKWEQDPAIGAFSVNTHCALLMVDRFSSEQLGWRGSVTATGYESKFFVTKAEAQLWCEAQLAELLRKDLESLGGGGVTPEQETDAESVIPLSFEGPRANLKLQVDGETRCGAFREWLWLKFWLPLEEDEEQEPWVQLTLEEARKLRNHLNQILAPAGTPKIMGSQPEAGLGGGGVTPEAGTP